MDHGTTSQQARDAQRSHGRRVMRGFYLIVALFGAVTLCLLIISQFQANILDSVRAYVAGEGLWSKGQKDAAYRLTRYALTRDEADYQAFLQGIDVTLGDKQARLALQQPEVDWSRARRGFLRGRNHPDDVEKLIAFFIDFQDISYMQSAIDIWTEGDQQIAVLRRLGESLHDEITSGSADDARIGAILQQVDEVNGLLTVLEDRFSSTLGEAARWSRELTRNVVFGSMLLLVSTVLLLSWRIVNGIRQTEQALVSSEARFRRIVESNMIGILFWQADGSVTEANDAFLHMLGYSRGELESGAINWREMTPPDCRAADEAALGEVLARGSCRPFEKEYLHKDGHRVAVYIGGALLEGRPNHGVAFVLDVSKRREAEQTQRLAAAVFQAAAEAIMVTDSTATIQAVNPAFTLITGYSEEEAIGKNPNILRSDHHDKAFFREMWRELKESDRWRGEIWNRRKDGQIFPEWLSIGAIRDQRNEVVQYVGIFSDISDRKAREEVIWHQAHYDILTDLPNRALFRDRLSQHIALAKREQSLVAVMFIDLDNFKEVNDSLGHRAGDQLLQDVAGRLSNSIRESDTVARLSGDEFTVILPHLHRARDAEQIAETIVEACAAPYTVAGRQVTVTVSVGIAFYPTHALNIDSLLNRADEAMYAAKEGGRNRFRFYGRNDQSGRDSAGEVG